MPVLDVPGDLWQHALLYAGVRECGAWSCTCRAASKQVENPFLWHELYSETQRDDVDDSALKDLIERPFGPDAVGWRVQVLQHTSGVWRDGTISEYDAGQDIFAVLYDDLPEPVWESEQRQPLRTNPSLLGKTRFFFAEPPQPPDAGAGEEPLGRAQGSSPPAPLLCQGSWRDELKANVEQVPRRLHTRLRGHADEVLGCAFSPDGRFLATASRDGTAHVYSIGERLGPTAYLPGPMLLHRPPGDADGDGFYLLLVFQAELPVCRVIWSPESDLLAICTENNSDVPDQQPLCSLVAMGAYAGGQTVAPPRLLVACKNRPYDLYVLFMRFAAFSPGLQVLGGVGVASTFGGFVQRLYVLELLPAEDGELVPSRGVKEVADLRVTLPWNYLHCLRGDNLGTVGSSGVFCALTGGSIHLCDQIAIVRLQDATLREEPGPPRVPLYDLHPIIVDIGCVSLSAVLTPTCEFVVTNTRAWVEDDRYERYRQHVGQARGPADLRHRAPPDIQTAVEVQVWRVGTHSEAGLELCTPKCISRFRGPHAFTTKDSPFLLWADYAGGGAPPDYVTTGGEDGRVYVWHARHQRLLHVLATHDDAVNCVSWHPHRAVLAASSDDFTTTVWTAGPGAMAPR